MQDKELFQIALGIKSPWYVSELRMDTSNQRVDIYIDFERGSEFECPECGGCPPHMIPIRGLGGTLISFSIKPTFMPEQGQVLTTWG